MPPESPRSDAGSPAGSLGRYQAKRDFKRTPEPAANAPDRRRSGPLTFTIQQHAASRLHYDVRLEIDGVLVSWSVPKGASLDPSARRLAVRTEDHPYDYGTFEGVIPKGEYGAGEVIVWDAGAYTAFDDDEPPDFSAREAAEQVARKGLERGVLRVFLNGRKLKGGWTLARTGFGTKDAREHWMLVKREDRFVDADRDVTREDRSVLSGRRLSDLRAGARPPASKATSVLPGAAGLAGARRAPFPTGLTPMLPTLVEAPFSSADWLYEVKLDGYRVLANVRGGKVELVSRRGNSLTGDFPLIARALGSQPVRQAIFDAEVVGLDEQGRPSFQRLQNRGGGASLRMLLYVFDLLYLDGWDLRQVPLEERKTLLRAALAPLGPLQYVEHFDDGLRLFDAARELGLEGVVAKRRDSVYAAGERTRLWLKAKATRADDFVIAGYTEGEGRRQESFGSLLLGQYDQAGTLRYVGNVGSGFDDRSLREVLDRLAPLVTGGSPFAEPLPKGHWRRRPRGSVTWVKPEVVAEVRYGERTDDRILRHAVFDRLREDKAAAEVKEQPLVAGPRSGGSSPLPGTRGRGMPAGHSPGGGAHARSPEPPPSSLRERGLEVLSQLEGAEKTLTLVVEGHEIGLTNLEKVLWPAWHGQPALTKRDLVRYYLRIAPYVLPHLRDRPLTMIRYPNGIHGLRFFQKTPEHPPDFVDRVTLYSEHNRRDVEYFLCNNVATLVWLAQLADLELHVTHTHTTAAPDAPELPTTYAGSAEGMERSTMNHPDFLVVDLDPYLYSGEEQPGAEPELHVEGFKRAREAAYWFRELLCRLGLEPFLKTTGKTGLHLYVPIARTLPYDVVRGVAETLAQALVRAHRRRLTVEWAVEKRTGKVFLDYGMNRRAATLAAPYSPRAVGWAGVSMPVSWDDLDRIYPTDFTIATVPARLDAAGDLWAGILDARHDLRKVLSSSARVA